MTRRRPHHVSHARREAILGSRWVQTVSCYRITTAYLMVAVLIFILLLVVD